MLTTIISFGVILAFALVAFCTIRWWNLTLTGVTPMPLYVFIAILFTSGLDVGLIMFPLAFDFPLYADTVAEPAYGVTNPLALEFGFWGFLIWAFYFLTTFYFCAIEPRVKFFEIPAVKILNNVVIIATCAFTGALFINYMPYYIIEVGDGETILPVFYLICFLVILIASFSSTDLKFVRVLSVSSTGLFLCLIGYMWYNAGMSLGDFTRTASNIGGYFGNIEEFITPMTAYHEFYLFWWFAWSIMIGQFVARFVGGLKTWQLLAALLIFPSIPLGMWFSVLYFYFLNDIGTDGLPNWAMTIVGIVFVINSFDSLIRLYTDNLNLTTERFGTVSYVFANAIGLFVLSLLFTWDFLKIEWIGTVVIGIYLLALNYLFFLKRKQLTKLTGDARPIAE
ncbi:BCCT family transporter [Sulfitobacter sp. F26169L]|uniref:BCCT family transporter n=1 Tax=Sulfitobacter sp. F26169L TaxID=2996015 RepID=UPI002260AA96|nr:BCCT family transporter [Sulfitobacter sp. F26169L]MCX7564807.1 BCCT family transporter [Sulfitobacter sp. F26169L]